MNFISSTKATETEKQGLVDTATSPVSPDVNHISTNTKPPRVRNVGITCTRDHRPKTATATAQTSLTLKDDIIRKNDVMSHDLQIASNHRDSDTFHAPPREKRELDEETYQMFLKKFRSNMVDSVTMTEQDLLENTNNKSSVAMETSAVAKVKPLAIDRGASIEKKPVTLRGQMTVTPRQNGTYAFIPNIGKPTVMAKPVVPPKPDSSVIAAKLAANKKMNTPPARTLVDASTNTPVSSRTLEVPLAFRGGVVPKPTTCSRGMLDIKEIDNKTVTKINSNMNKK